MKYNLFVEETLNDPPLEEIVIVREINAARQDELQTTPHFKAKITGAVQRMDAKLRQLSPEKRAAVEFIIVRRLGRCVRVCEEAVRLVNIQERRTHKTAEAAKTTSDFNEKVLTKIKEVFREAGRTYP